MEYSTSIEPAVTYESNRFITDEETPDEELFTSPYIVKDVLICGMVTLFVAAAKTFKTTLISILANLVAAGAPDFLGHRIHQARVLYLTNEDPLVARKRFRASKRQLCISSAVSDVIFYGGPAFLITMENVRKLCEDLKAMGDMMPKLVVIDPIASMFAGEMINATDVLAFKLCLDELTQLGIAVLCGHHTNRRAIDGSDPMDMIFGSQVFQSAFGFAFSLTRERIENPNNKKQTIPTGKVIFDTIFQKDARPIEQVKFAKTMIEMPFADEDGDHPTSPFLLPYGCPLTAGRMDLQAD